MTLCLYLNPLRRSAIAARKSCVVIRTQLRPAAPFSVTTRDSSNESQRHKLIIGTSLSAQLPLSAAAPSTNAPSDRRSSILLHAFRHGVSSLDCPAPPSLDSFESCWDANRQSEVDMVRSLDALDSDKAELLQDTAVLVTTRLGYRSAIAADFDREVDEMEGTFHGDARIAILDAGSERADGETEWVKPPVVLVHNLSEEYVLHSLRSSPLVKKKLDEKEGAIKLISLAHNPETQMSAHLMSGGNDGDATSMHRHARLCMKQSLTSAFVGYELAVKEGLIDGYGVDSNGLSLPTDHDMYCNWRDVLECAANAYIQVYGSEGSSNNSRSSLRVIRLPGNLLERRGLDVAKEIHAFFHDSENESLGESSTLLPHTEQMKTLRQMRTILPSSVEVNVTRPLTAFPFGGTGWEPNSSPGLTESSGAPPLFLEKRGADGKKIDSTHPIRILDYRIESSPLGQAPYLEWTNYHLNHHGLRPSLYQGVLNAALSHFDASNILDASKERELTVEERETLDGCKLLRDMIHDLDASLDTMKSFAAYEEYLVNVAMPLLYGSFEELDEESAGVLQAFFAVHGTAVRMVVAKWTRELLTGENEDKKEEMSKLCQALGLGEYHGGYKIPVDVTLQEYSLRYLMREESIGGIVVGCSSPDHVLEALKAADNAAT